MENKPYRAKKTSGLICASDYVDGWLPACAGMTGFFVMYRAQADKIIEFIIRIC